MPISPACPRTSRKTHIEWVQAPCTPRVFHVSRDDQRLVGLTCSTKPTDTISSTVTSGHGRGMCNTKPTSSITAPSKQRTTSSHSHGTRLPRYTRRTFHSLTDGSTGKPLESTLSNLHMLGRLADELCLSSRRGFNKNMRSFKLHVATENSSKNDR